MVSSLDQKAKYSESEFTKRNKKGEGFIANNLATVIYAPPFLLLMQLLLAFVAFILSKCALGLQFRKYCLGATYLILVCEGNIEQFTFFMFSELSYFFSLSMVHKLVNIGILFFYSFVLFTAFALFFWVRFHSGTRSGSLF